MSVTSAGASGAGWAGGRAGEGPVVEGGAAVPVVFGAVVVCELSWLM